MLISSTIKPFLPANKPGSTAESTQPNDADQYQFSSAAKDTVEIVGGAALGAVPVVGAFKNYLGLLNFGIGGDTVTASLSLAGAASNVLGTLALTGGAVTGHANVLKVGVGLLAGSALTAGYGEFRDR
jgi:hypothetical protein